MKNSNFFLIESSPKILHIYIISRCISSKTNNHLRKELWRKAKVNEFSLNDETRDLKWHSIVVVVDVAEEKKRCNAIDKGWIDFTEREEENK